MKLKLDLARRSYRELIYVDVNGKDFFRLKKDVASYAAGRKVRGEEIRELNLDPLAIAGLDYDKRTEIRASYEFFKHQDNGRKGSIAYFPASNEVHIELM